MIQNSRISSSCWSIVQEVQNKRGSQSRQTLRLPYPLVCQESETESAQLCDWWPQDKGYVSSQTKRRPAACDSTSTGASNNKKQEQHSRTGSAYMRVLLNSSQITKGAQTSSIRIFWIINPLWFEETWVDWRLSKEEPNGWSNLVIEDITVKSEGIPVPQ